MAGRQAHYTALLMSQCIEGDLRVHNDTIVVTYYNAPNAGRWQDHFDDLPRRLENEGVDPRVPWLYNFKLDFRFK